MNCLHFHKKKTTFSSFGGGLEGEIAVEWGAQRDCILETTKGCFNRKVGERCVRSNAGKKCEKQRETRFITSQLPCSTVFMPLMTR